MTLMSQLIPSNFSRDSDGKAALKQQINMRRNLLNPTQPCYAACLLAGMPDPEDRIQITKLVNEYLSEKDQCCSRTCLERS